MYLEERECTRVTRADLGHCTKDTPPPRPGDTLRRGVRLLQDHSAARAGRSSLCVRRAPHRVARGSGLRPCPARPLSGLPLRLCAQHSLPFVLQRLLSGFERPVLGSGEIRAGSHSTCSTPHATPTVLWSSSEPLVATSISAILFRTAARL